ncbi:MAG: flagellar hook-associated protein FlgL [Eubacteriales bacterium]
MRITNSMMRNNILMGLNKNKSQLSRLEQQMATGKKIQKPSEDPIVAVRAIKLRTNLREIDQYRSNINDALSWMGVTEQALTNITDVMKRIRDLSVQASSDTLGTGEREKIVSELEQLKSQIQQEGNVNYAGRFVFTGYKTDTSLIFNNENTETYQIKEEFSSEDIEEMTYIQDGTPPAQMEAYRVRLAYDNLQDADPPINSIPTNGGADLNINTINSTDVDSYQPLAGEVNFLQDTGELIFNENDVNNVNPDFSFTYDKSGFNKNDLNPVHYFETVHKVDPLDNTTWVNYANTNDKIEYQVSYNQDIEVNSLGKNVITNDLVRDIDELIKETKNIPNDESDKQTLLEDELGKKFEAMISKADKHIKNIVGATADLGSRMNRLELTDNRLENDDLNFTDLMSQNEDVDISEVVVDMKSYETVYNASLMSSASIMKPSLLDFIR